MQKKENSKVLSNVLTITRLALVAAIYVALTLLIYPLEYGTIQCRISEALVLLCFYRKDYAISMILGCLIANLFSPLGLVDIILGPLATAIAVIPMYYMKNIYLAALLPVVSNGIIVGVELTVLFAEYPLWINIASVALGELVAVGILGIVLFKLIFEKNELMLKLIGSTRKISQKTAEV